MVEILALIRRNRLSATKQELARIGCDGYSQFAVLGRGRQRGLRGEEHSEGLRFLPKILLELIVADARSGETIEAIIRANQTGQFGDGRIFVIEMNEAYRISTGEHTIDELRKSA